MDTLETYQKAIAPMMEMAIAPLMENSVDK
jgi:hypothetical protein